MYVPCAEASHLEMEPCTRLRDLGMTACEKNIGVEESFEEPNRDFKSFGRRESELPMQKEDDAIDLRNILHRDGSVLSAVTPAMLARLRVPIHPGALTHHPPPHACYQTSFTPRPHTSVSTRRSSLIDPRAFERRTVSNS